MSRDRGPIDTHGGFGTDFFHPMLPRMVHPFEDEALWPIPDGGLVSFFTIKVGRRSPMDVPVGRMEPVVLYRGEDL